MTSQRIYRLHCDAPGCTTAVLVEALADPVDGWTRIRSEDHLRDWSPGRVPAAGRRTRADRRTRNDVLSGSFTLHLCHEHRDAFTAHVPLTTGTMSGRAGERNTTVACSCGQFSTWGIRQAHRVGPRSEGPAYLPERAWWSHLPAALKTYATRSLSAQ